MLTRKWLSNGSHSFIDPALSCSTGVCDVEVDQALVGFPAWIAAESLEAALRYVRHRYDDFIIAEVRFPGMIPLLSGSPLD
jgi:hypothetical protein